MREYSNGEITVIWTPELCSFSGICVKMLPQVYRPAERPWVKVKCASTEELIKQVNACPTGALAWRLDVEE